MEIHFGKYRGKTVEHVLGADFQYLCWLLSGFTCRSKTDTRLVEYVYELIENNPDWIAFDNSKRLEFMANCKIYS